MSTLPLSRPPRPGGELLIDDEELSRFRAWLVGRGYSERTVKLWAVKTRLAYRRGVICSADVDRVFSNYKQNTRCTLRQALQNFDVFRRGGR